MRVDVFEYVVQIIKLRVEGIISSPWKLRSLKNVIYTRSYAPASAIEQFLKLARRNGERERGFGYRVCEKKKTAKLG